MNLTKKYNIKMKYNQFGTLVESDFQDYSEETLMNLFENYVSDLKIKNKRQYNMIEFGSNYCYYSMLFKKILNDEKTLNILVDPYDYYLNNGIEHFKLNNLDGIFLKRKIYNPELWCGIKFDCLETGIDDLLSEYNIEELDVLHMDIDGSEYLGLETAKNSLNNKKIDLMFILTHSLALHSTCKEKLLSYGYSCLYDDPEKNNGNDGLIIFKR